jgi:hypothetical protein
MGFMARARKVFRAARERDEEKIAQHLVAA